MLAKALAYLMLMMIARGVPGLKDENDKALDPRREEISQLAQHHADVASEGALVDPVTDAIILASVSLYESSHRLRPPDGDRRMSMVSREPIGTAVGPMQISKVAPRYVKTWFVGKYNDLTVEKMRDPRTNVQLCYDILKFWKTQCGGPPGVWLTAYGWGRCPTKNTVDWEGKRRCKTITKTMKLMEARQELSYRVPENWGCVQEVKP